MILQQLGTCCWKTKTNKIFKINNNKNNYNNNNIDAGGGNDDYDGDDFDDVYSTNFLTELNNPFIATPALLEENWKN